MKIKTCQGEEIPDFGVIWMEQGKKPKWHVAFNGGLSGID